MDKFELIDCSVKCKRFKDAFVFDEILSRGFNIKNKFGLKALILWFIDHRYGALVNLRLLQMVYWKRQISKRKIEERSINIKSEGIHSFRKIFSKAFHTISKYKFVVLTHLYLCLFTLIDRILKFVYSFSVSPHAQLDKGFYGSMRNIAVGGYTKIGKNATIHGNVTIAPYGKKYSNIGDNVHIGTGVVIIGGVKIGDNVTISPNSVVINNVPSNCTVIGNPAKIIYRKDTI